VAPKLQTIACWYDISPFAHRNRKIEGAFRQGTIRIHEFETRGAILRAQRIRFMGIAMHDHRSHRLERPPPPLRI
jgi:hypothetical protein